MERKLCLKTRLKSIYLSTKNISKKWDQAYRNWGPILSELSIMFDNRI